MVHDERERVKVPTRVLNLYVHWSKRVLGHAKMLFAVHDLSKHAIYTTPPTFREKMHKKTPKKTQKNQKSNFLGKFSALIYNILLFHFLRKYMASRGVVHRKKPKETQK